MPRSPGSAGGSTCSSLVRISPMATSTPRKLTALAANAPGTPASGMITPARLMPRIRPPELSTEPSARPLDRSSGPTTSAPNRPRAGEVIAVTMPDASEIAYRPPVPDGSPAAITASTVDSAAWAICPAATTYRAGSRSAITPPHGPSSMVGRACRTRPSPTLVAEWVMDRMSQFIARTCIHVPVIETKSAVAQSR
ncbi:hypothetical protein amrb99_96480 [Actinomadura sp. RB99]|nr:hypothetical protein [Actinomadura sp. RB99]